MKPQEYRTEHLWEPMRWQWKPQKKNTVSIASANSHPAQLFKIIRSLTTLEPDHTNTTLALNCEDFVNYFATKIQALRQDFPQTSETMNKLETPCSSPGMIFDSFKKLNHAEVTKVLAAVRPTTSPLDPCPSWLIKSDDASNEAKIKKKPLQDIINLSLESGISPQNLKEAVVRSYWRKLL